MTIHFSNRFKSHPFFQTVTMRMLCSLMAVSLTRFTGGFLGASVTVDVLPQPRLVNVCGGQRVIIDGRAETSSDGHVVMDDYTQHGCRGMA